MGGGGGGEQMYCLLTEQSKFEATNVSFKKKKKKKKKFTTILYSHNHTLKQVQIHSIQKKNTTFIDDVLLKPVTTYFRWGKTTTIYIKKIPNYVY